MTTTLTTTRNSPDPWTAPWAPADPEAYCTAIAAGVTNPDPELEAVAVPAGLAQRQRQLGRERNVPLAILEATGVTLDLAPRDFPHPLSDDLRVAIAEEALPHRPVVTEADIRRMRRRVRPSPSDTTAARRSRHIAAKAARLGISVADAQRMTHRRPGATRAARKATADTSPRRP